MPYSLIIVSSSNQKNQIVILNGVIANVFCSRKISEIGWIKVFKIFGKIKTKKIWITGTCCWEIEGKNQKKHTLELGYDKKPPIQYIRKFRTKKCS